MLVTVGDVILVLVPILTHLYEELREFNAEKLYSKGPLTSPEYEYFDQSLSTSYSLATETCLSARKELLFLTPDTPLTLLSNATSQKEFWTSYYINSDLVIKSTSGQPWVQQANDSIDTTDWVALKRALGTKSIPPKMISIKVDENTFQYVATEKDAQKAVVCVTTLEFPNRPIDRQKIQEVSDSLSLAIYSRLGFLNVSEKLFGKTRLIADYPLEEESLEEVMGRASRLILSTIRKLKSPLDLINLPILSQFISDEINFRVLWSTRFHFISQPEQKTVVVNHTKIEHQNQYLPSFWNLSFNVPPSLSTSNDFFKINLIDCLLVALGSIVTITGCASLGCLYKRGKKESKFMDFVTKGKPTTAKRSLLMGEPSAVPMVKMTRSRTLPTTLKVERPQGGSTRPKTAAPPPPLPKRPVEMPLYLADSDLSIDQIKVTKKPFKNWYGK